MPKVQHAVGAFTDAQLHALACIVCAKDDGGLLPNGHVQTQARPGEPLTWAVAACPEHRRHVVTALIAPEPVAAGVGWDVAAIPAGRGLRLYEWLAADYPDQLGPVAYSARSWQTYWLVTGGTFAKEWPPGCRLLGPGSWVTLPQPGLDAHSACWLHRPDADLDTAGLTLTGATWLAAAVHTYTPGDPS
jgi:hypothetical protein